MGDPFRKARFCLELHVPRGVTTDFSSTHVIDWTYEPKIYWLGIADCGVPIARYPGQTRASLRDLASQASIKYHFVEIDNRRDIHFGKVLTINCYFHLVELVVVISFSVLLENLRQFN